MLLDEPGEHLDPATADTLIRDIFGSVGANRAVVVVTHRLSPLDQADHVIMLDSDETGHATIVDQGTHEELLTRNRQYSWSVRQEG